MGVWFFFLVLKVYMFISFIFASLETRKNKRNKHVDFQNQKKKPNFHDSHRFGLTQNSLNLAFPSLPSVRGHLASSNQHHLQSWGRQHLLFICHHLERYQVSHLATSASPPPAGRTPVCQRVSPQR